MPRDRLAGAVLEVDAGSPVEMWVSASLVGFVVAVKLVDREFPRHGTNAPDDVLRRAASRCRSLWAAPDPDRTATGRGHLVVDVRGRRRERRHGQRHASVDAVTGPDAREGGRRRVTGAEASAAISMGSVGGGPGSDGAWSDAVTEVMRRVVQVCNGVVLPLSLNVVFHVPGRYVEPESEGVQTTRFSRRDSKLMIQAALFAGAPHDSRAHLVQILREAVDLAEEFACRKGLVVGRLSDVRSVLAALG